ncbi:MAG: hypothetical protein HYV09_16020 [Deltaproteobacteria bacterium]|nr:hypothetical protein [Deltaproteobacteria bacterium]
MLRIRYPLERGGPARLEVSWTDAYRTLLVHLDDVLVASADVQSLRSGRVFELPDGRSLRVMVGRGVSLWVSGVAVPGTYADPWVRVKSAPVWVLSLAMLAAWRAWQLAPERPWPVGTWANLALAIALFAAGLAMRRGSLVAHVVAGVAAIVFFAQAFPRASLAIDEEARSSLEVLPLLARLLGVVSYVTIAVWIVRKIAKGTRAAREIRDPDLPPASRPYR